MYLLICILQSLTLTHIHMLTLSHRKAPRLALDTGYILSKYICDNNNNNYFLEYEEVEITSSVQRSCATRSSHRSRLSVRVCFVELAEDFQF